MDLSGLIGVQLHNPSGAHMSSSGLGLTDRGENAGSNPVMCTTLRSFAEREA